MCEANRRCRGPSRVVSTHRAHARLSLLYPKKPTILAMARNCEFVQFQTSRDDRSDLRRVRRISVGDCLYTSAKTGLKRRWLRNPERNASHTLEVWSRPRAALPTELVRATWVGLAARYSLNSRSRCLGPIPKRSATITYQSNRPLHCCQ